MGKENQESRHNELMTTMADILVEMKKMTKTMEKLVVTVEEQHLGWHLDQVMCDTHEIRMQGMVTNLRLDEIKEIGLDILCSMPT